MSYVKKVSDLKKNRDFFMKNLSYTEYMKFEELAEKVLSQKTLTAKEWPDMLLPPNDSISGFFSSKNKFWERIKELHKYTVSGADRFSKNHKGSTGWEHELILLYINDSFYYSSAKNSRHYEEVRSSHSYQIDTKIDQKKQAVFDYIILDGRKVGQMEWIGVERIKKRINLVENRKFIGGFICHFHSHPQVQYPLLNKRIYTYFSPQDMSSFFSSPMKMTGLVTDRLWIACKTAKSTFPTQKELGEITIAEALNPDKFVETAGETLKKHGIVLYMGEFNSNLKRVN